MLAAPPLPFGLPAPARLCPPPGHSPKAPAGKSFTIDALLARPDPCPPPPPGAGRWPPGWPDGAWPGAALQLCAQAHPLLQPRPLYPVCFPALVGSRAPLRASGYLLSKCCPFPAFKARPGKSKRVRTIFTSDQLARLEKEFARQQYMVGTERCLLASALHLTEEQALDSALLTLGLTQSPLKEMEIHLLTPGLWIRPFCVAQWHWLWPKLLHTRRQVKVWFQNRRIKWRKQSLEQQQAKLVKMGLATSQRSPDSQTHQGEGGDRDFTEEPTDESHFE